MNIAMTSLPSALVRLLRRQQGLITRAQLIEMTSRQTARSLIAAGIVVPAAYGVYRSATVEVSYAQDVLAACLSIGDPVAGCGLTAAHLWDVDQIVVPDKVYLVVPAGRNPKSTEGVHVRRGTLPAFDIATRHGVPITTPARTLLDLTVRMPASLVRTVAREFFRRADIAPNDIRTRLGQRPLPKFDRPLINELLEETSAGVGESPKEDWVRDVLVAAGLPEPERQVTVKVNGRTYRLDLAYVPLRIAFEYDSWEFHQDRRAFDRDRHKSADLQSISWLVLQISADWSAYLVVERTKRAIEVQEARLKNAAAG